MSAVMATYENDDMSYAVDFGRDRQPAKTRARHPEYRRKGSAPAGVNGMHCRRNKRWTWGSGRGARVITLRAFAGCLAAAVIATACSAVAAPINMQFLEIGNPGNPGNVTSSGTWGAVSAVFRMAETETTNAQYVEFLNSVDPSGVNPNGVYNVSSGTSANGGIVFNANATTGAKYSVKSGLSGRVGAAYAAMPVNFVNWFSAARFANWLNNGQQTGAAGTASMEIGAYTLNNRTSGAIVARNPGATVFLPSVNEWYKAGYYTGAGSTYTTYATNSNTVPTATVTNFSDPNAGNFSSVSGGPLNVGSYIAATSAYGMYDMFGNVSEMTDTPNGIDQFRAVGGAYGALPAAWTATASAVFVTSSSATQTYGFRVAAVPEPGTIALAGVGIAGLAGLDWMKRRKKRLAARNAA